MLIKDHMSRSGAHLFRWRSYVLLAFVPLFVWAAFQGEMTEAWLGETAGDAFEVLAMALVILGQTVRILTVGFAPRGTSGRNTSGQLAEVLNTTGLYSVVRNPLYLGNCMMYLGVALFSQNIAVAVILILVLLPYYERIIAAEEGFLTEKFGAAYVAWAERTPAFIPRLSGFQRPAMGFSWRSVIRREQASVLGAVAALYLMELGLHTLGPEGEPLEAGWHWTMAIALVLFAVAQVLKKHTRLLEAEGR